MDIGWEGVVFLWVMFLWPVLLGGIYLVWKKGALKSKGKFFLASVAVGYLALLVGNFLGAALLLGFVKVAGISGESANTETVVNSLTAVTAAILFLLPALTTHYMAKRFS